ncbi:MAG: hypothetical protein RI958_2984 [Actinomycetota bacterium]
MIKRTYGDVKDELRRVAGQTGLIVDDARIKLSVNLVQERLCTQGEWPYQYARVKFRQRGGVVALPTQYEAIVHSAVEREPIETQPPWFEFLEFGPGPYVKGEWANYGLDMGEHPTYVAPPSMGATVRLTSTDGSDSGTVKIFGLDTNGVAKSENLVLPEATTSTVWSRIVQVVKPKTVGDVVLTFVDTFGQEYVGADYRARDVNPTFRLYRFTAIADDDTKMIDAIVRRRLFDVDADTDELFITNLNALRLGVKAVALLDKGDIQASEMAFAAASQILRDEGTRYRNHHPLPVNGTKISAMSERGDIY